MVGLGILIKDFAAALAALQVRFIFCFFKIVFCFFAHIRHCGAYTSHTTPKILRHIMYAKTKKTKKPIKKLLLHTYLLCDTV